MSLSPLEKAASGSLASVIANTLIYPLDLSKTIVQTQVKKKGSGDKKATDEEYQNVLHVLQVIKAKKGVIGWYQGLFASIFGTAAQNFSYFYWYTVVRRMYARIYKLGVHHKSSTATELFLGAVAAAISQLFTMPIGVLTTQQQTSEDHSKGWYDHVKEILEHDGIAGLWRGLKVSLVLCVNPSITYGSYERLKQILFNDKEFLGPLESFTVGMMAKSMATIATQPLIVSKAILQKKAAPKKEDSNGKNHPKGEKDAFERDQEENQEEDDVAFTHFTHALVHLWNTEKFRGLYKGIGPQLLKGVFVQGLLFMFKDQIDLLFLFILKYFKTRKSLLRR